MSCAPMTAGDAAMIVACIVAMAITARALWVVGIDVGRAQEMQRRNNAEVERLRRNLARDRHQADA